MNTAADTAMTIWQQLEIGVLMSLGARDLACTTDDDRA